MSMVDRTPAHAGLRERMTAVIGTRRALPLLPYAHYGARKLGLAGIVGIALCLFSGVTSLTANAPLHDRVAEQSIALERERASAGTADTSRRVTGRVDERRNVVDELPAREELSEYLGRIVAIADASNLSLDRGDYEFATTQSSEISSYRVTLPVRGGYPQVRRFIEDTLAGIPAIALESLRVERNAVTDQVVAADLEFAILVRNGP